MMISVKILKLPGQSCPKGIEQLHSLATALWKGIQHSVLAKHFKSWPETRGSPA